MKIFLNVRILLKYTSCRQNRLYSVSVNEFSMTRVTKIKRLQLYTTSNLRSISRLYLN